MIIGIIFKLNIYSQEETKDLNNTLNNTVFKKIPQLNLNIKPKQVSIIDKYFMDKYLIFINRFYNKNKILHQKKVFN